MIWQAKSYIEPLIGFAGVAARLGGCFVLEDRQQFSVVKDDASPKFDRKSPNSRSKKTSAARRKTVKRQPVFKSDNWYEKAALSMAIRAKL
jgi:hypothetical protein